jgi:hypothetical protein
MYPEAVYATHYQIQNPDGSTHDMYAYFGHGDKGDFIIAIDGLEGVTPATVEESAAPLPMSYGSGWSGLESTFDTEARPGIRSVGSLTSVGEVDGWGTVTVPAGAFPYLRLHQATVGSTRYEGSAEFEALGVLDLETEGYCWNTHILGPVFSVSQTSISFRNGSAPPVVTTQVARLIEASSMPSVVAEIGWGQLKANHMAALRATP